MNKLHIVVDVESDGPCPGLHSMVCFGAATVEKSPSIFYGELSPISDKYIPEALAVSGFTREEHLRFTRPMDTMIAFSEWLDGLGADRVVFISDNLAYDWQFINYYCHVFLGTNPFGFSGRRIGDIYAGLTRRFYNQNDWKKYRKTKHSHNPVDDALGNVEALLELTSLFKIGF